MTYGFFLRRLWAFFPKTRVKDLPGDYLQDYTGPQASDLAGPHCNICSDSTGP